MAMVYGCEHGQPLCVPPLRAGRLSQAKEDLMHEITVDDYRMLLCFLALVRRRRFVFSHWRNN